MRSNSICAQRPARIPNAFNTDNLSLRAFAVNTIESPVVNLTSATPATDSAFAIRVESVSHSFPNGVQALRNVSLRVQPGEFVSLIGPSGCGKSTLLRLVAGLLKPSAGSVALDLPASASEMGFVFQSATLMPWTTVERNVRLPLELRGVSGSASEHQVRDALQRVGLSDFANAYPRELSGGMQMRASIARALVTNPSILLLDEPFGALDEITRERLDQDLLGMWRGRSLTVLFVTHSVFEAVFLSTRIVVMSPRPGIIAAEFAIDPAHARTPEYRTSDHFARTARDVSVALREAGSVPS